MRIAARGQRFADASGAIAQANVAVLAYRLRKLGEAPMLLRRDERAGVVSVIDRPPDTGAAWSAAVYGRVAVPRRAALPAGGPAENPRPARRAHEWPGARPP